MNLFRSGEFTLASGAKSGRKIDCDALTDADWETLAAWAAEVLPPFGVVEGVPTGGLKFASALADHATLDAATGPLLIADDVLTTGGSMERQRAGRLAIGVVLFARGRLPDWVYGLIPVSGF
jgi:orotate phosphoribosyltransferase